MGPPIREDKRGRRWVPASARTRGGGEDGSPHPRGQEGEKMGSRIREDKGRGSREGNEILHSASLRSE